MSPEIRFPDFSCGRRGFVIRPEVLNNYTDVVRPPKRHWPATAVAVCTWLYVAAVMAVWLLLWLGGDRWWLATVILFGPRWLCTVPLAVLWLTALLVRRRSLWVLAAAAIVALVPVMGFCFPWGWLTAGNGPSLRVLSSSVKCHCYNNQRLEELIAVRPARHRGSAKLLGTDPHPLAGRLARLPRRRVGGRLARSPFATTARTIIGNGPDTGRVPTCSIAPSSCPWATLVQRTPAKSARGTFFDPRSGDRAAAVSQHIIGQHA